jgi:single-strand DNA-binding protein
VISDLNVVVLTGRVTIDPDLDRTKRGTPICTFGIAVTRYYRGDRGLAQEVTHLTVTTWGRLAEECAAELTRGVVVRLEGEIRQARWPERGKITVVADVVVWPQRRVDGPVSEPTDVDLEPQEVAGVET